MRFLFAILVFFNLSFLNATNFENKLNMGTVFSTIDNKSSTELKLGYSSTTDFFDEFILGFGNNIYFGVGNSFSNLLTFDLDLTAGYYINRDTSIFLIGNYIIQKNNQIYYDGFGYGISLEQKLSYNVTLECLIRMADLENKDLQYKYNSAGLAIKYIF